MPTATVLSNRPWIRTVCVSAAMLALLAAALLKLMDLTAFAVTLRSWATIPIWIVPLLAVGVPVVELVAACSWLLRVERTWSLVIALCAVVAFSLALIAETVLHKAPTCGCLGHLSGLLPWLERPPGLATRNAVIIGLLLVGMPHALRNIIGRRHGHLIPVPCEGTHAPGVHAS